MSQEKNNTKTRKKQYEHLCFKERELIEQWEKEGITQSEIARRLNRDRSTIYRERKRGTTTQLKGNKKKVRLYLADTGQANYEKNRKNSCPKKKERFSKRFFYKIEKAKSKGKFNGKNRTYNIKTFVSLYKKNHPKENVPTFKSVYRYIRDGELTIKPHDLPLMYQLGPRKNKHSDPKGSNKKGLGRSISKRPKAVLKRTTFGHWEADLVKGKRTKGEPAILTLVERKTKYALTTKLADSKSQTVLQTIKDIVKRKHKLFHSITFDNGSEFSQLSSLDSENLSIYFAHAYAAWERGSNENFNKLLREFVKKGTSLHEFSSDYIQEATNKINQRVRAILDCVTAQKAMEKEISLLNEN